MAGPGERTTAAQKETRVQEVLNLLIDGATRAQIQQALSSDTKTRRALDVSDRTVDNYIAAATQRIREYGRTNFEENFGKGILRFEKIYRKAMLRNDCRSAVQANAEMCKLHNAYPPQKRAVEFSGPDGGPVAFTREIAGLTDEQIEQRIAEIKRKRGLAGRGADASGAGAGKAQD